MALRHDWLRISRSFAWQIVFLFVAESCSDLHPATHDREVALDSVKASDAWEQSPTFESELFEQSQGWFVVRENEADHRIDRE